MKPKVAIIDYGLGNLYSVSRAFEVSGAEVFFASYPDQIIAAEHLVLPGVGAFKSGMAGLRERDLVEPIRQHALAGKPLLGICLGMQMLATYSEEFGVHEGLNLIPGRVLALPQTAVDGEAQKVPNVGWSGLHKAADSDWERTALRHVKEGDEIYMVHSFSVHVEKPEHELAFSLFGGHRVCAVIRNGGVIGCQFHPEKSGPIGLKILRQFLHNRELES